MKIFSGKSVRDKRLYIVYGFSLGIFFGIGMSGFLITRYISFLLGILSLAYVLYLKLEN